MGSSQPGYASVENTTLHWIDPDGSFPGVLRTGVAGLLAWGTGGPEFEFRRFDQQNQRVDGKFRVTQKPAWHHGYN